jgi:hypothetical protein
MGHALMILIVEPGLEPEAIAQRVADLMDPYDVDKEIESEEVVCDCTDDGDRPVDPDCEECAGTGVMTSWFNPQGYCDWYEPGGRWDGEIRGEPIDHPSTSVFAGPEEELRQLIRNTVAIADIPPDFDAYSLLTPDGEWHSSVDMDLDEWAREQAAIPDRYPGHFAVAIDYHY